MKTTFEMAGMLQGGGAVLDGGLHGDDDPLHPPPRPPMPVGHQPVQTGVPHNHRLYR